MLNGFYFHLGWQAGRQAGSREIHSGRKQASDPRIIFITRGVRSAHCAHSAQFNLLKERRRRKRSYGRRVGESRKVCELEKERERGITSTKPTAASMQTHTQF